MNGNGRARCGRNRLGKGGVGVITTPEQLSRLTPTYTSLPTQTNTHTHTPTLQQGNGSMFSINYVSYKNRTKHHDLDGRKDWSSGTLVLFLSFFFFVRVYLIHQRVEEEEGEEEGKKHANVKKLPAKKKKTNKRQNKNPAKAIQEDSFVVVVVTVPATTET